MPNQAILACSSMVVEMAVEMKDLELVVVSTVAVTAEEVAHGVAEEVVVAGSKYEKNL